MIEINRNQILEISMTEDLLPNGMTGKRGVEIKFMGEFFGHDVVVFNGVEFAVDFAQQPELGGINWIYKASSIGDFSSLGELLRMARPANIYVKKNGKAVENIGDGKINMGNEYPTTTPITDIKEIKKAINRQEDKESYFKMSNPNVFDTKTELDLLKARIEALETALQRVPYADYDRNIVITGATVGRSNGLTYPVYGDSYTGDGILILSSVSSVAYCVERPGRGEFIEIAFEHQQVNLKEVVYKGTLFKITDWRCNGNDEHCTYQAVSSGAFGTELMQEAKDQPILAGSYYQCQNPQCMVWSRRNINGATKCSHCGTIQQDM